MSAAQQATRLANFDRVIARFGGSDATDGILDRWKGDRESEPYLLVQRQNGVIWYEAFETLGPLEVYAEDESHEGWKAIAVVDLDSGELLDYRVKVIEAITVDASLRRPLDTQSEVSHGG